MIWSVVAHVFSVLLELLHISRMSDMDKDLEILVLRYQLGIADRKLNRTIKPCGANTSVIPFLPEKSHQI